MTCQWSALPGNINAPAWPTDWQAMQRPVTILETEKQFLCQRAAANHCPSQSCRSMHREYQTRNVCIEKNGPLGKMVVHFYSLLIFLGYACTAYSKIFKTITPNAKATSQKYLSDKMNLKRQLTHFRLIQNSYEAHKL